MNPLARLVHGAIRLYQKATERRPSPCRFVPTCSTYALEAVEEHGAIKGTWLGTKRICRCHPWGKHGYDPVPPRRGAGHALASAESAGTEPASADLTSTVQELQCST